MREKKKKKKKKRKEKEKKNRVRGVWVNSARLNNLGRP